MSVYKAIEWEQNNRWHCIDTSNLSGGSAFWWLPCRILDLTPADFIKLLINEYHADVSWSTKGKCKENGLLLWSWSHDKQSDMRKFKNRLNAAARKKNFTI